MLPSRLSLRIASHPHSQLAQAALTPVFLLAPCLTPSPDRLCPCFSSSVRTPIVGSGAYSECDLPEHISNAVFQGGLPRLPGPRLEGHGSHCADRALMEQG